MKRIFLILAFLIIAGSAFAATIDFQGMWSGGDCMGCRPGMIFFQKTRIGTHTYWAEPRTDLWNTPRTDLWNTARNTEVSE